MSCIFIGRVVVFTIAVFKVVPIFSRHLLVLHAAILEPCFYLESQRAIEDLQLTAFLVPQRQGWQEGC